MKIIFDIFSILIILGIIQCLILSFILVFIKKGNKSVNYILALFLISGSFSISTGVMYSTNLFYYIPHLIKIGLNCQLLLGPLLYLYIKGLISINFRYKPKMMIHFVPFFLYFLFWIRFYFSFGSYKINYLKRWLNNEVTGMYYFFEIIWVVLIIIHIWSYIIAVLILLRRHNKYIKENFSNIEKINLSWIKYSIFGFIILYVFILLLFLLLLIINFKYKYINILIPLGAAFFVYSLGYRGLMQKEIFTYNNYNISMKSFLPLKESEVILKKLVELIINQKKFLDPDISIKKVAKALSLSPVILSKIINEYFKDNFFNFINNYRIKEAKEHLIKNKNVNINLEEFSKKFGYKSKEVFLKRFEYYTQSTPDQFIKKYKNIKISNKIKTIGIFIDSLYDTYGVTILRGANQYTKKNNINLLCFNGGAHNSPYYNYSQKSVIYDLVDAGNVDGIIVISVLLGSFINKNELLKFYKKYSQIPIISIGMEIEGMNSLIIDNKKGLKDLLLHLIDYHGYRRIAYINGPEGNLDAIERLNVYKEVLKEKNIEFDPNLIAPGTFLGVSGNEAVKLFLDERKIHFDAIFAANDYMAINAIYELQNRGIRVPEDVAVVGFDDIIEDKYLMRPLTTVAQPLHELGYRAAQKLNHIINGNKTLDKEILNTGLVIRDSCGCNILKLRNNYKKNQNLKSTDLNLDYKNFEEYFIPEVISLMYTRYGGLTNPEKISEWISIILKSIFFEIDNINNSDGSFIKNFKEIITESVNKKIDMDFWHQVISMIFDKIFLLIKEENVLKRIRFFYDEIINLIDLINGRIQEEPIFNNYTHIFDLITIRQAMLTINDMDDFREILIKELPKIGIKSFYLSLYEDFNNNISEYSKNIVAYKNYSIVNYTPDELRFKTIDLVPGGIKDNIIKNFFILMSLYFQDEKIGFMIFESDASDNSFLELLVKEINYALKIINLNTELYKKLKRLKAGDLHIDKYKKSSLTKEKSEEYLNILLKYMQVKKIFTDPDLTLPSLAKQVGISRNHLSYIINEYLGNNFYDFINSYRVEEAKSILDNKDSDNINIIQIAYDSGFKSKSTFNKIFKNYTNMTPSEYKKKIKIILNH